MSGFGSQERGVIHLMRQRIMRIEMDDGFNDTGRLPSDAGPGFWRILNALSGASVVGFLVATWLALHKPLLPLWLSDFLNKWQTLEAGILALLAGIATVITIRRQIDQGERQAEERLERRQYAAKAALPAALAALVEYSDKCLSGLKSLRGFVTPSGRLKGGNGMAI